MLQTSGDQPKDSISDEYEEYDEYDDAPSVVKETEKNPESIVIPEDQPNEYDDGCPPGTKKDYYGRCRAVW